MDNKLREVILMQAHEILNDEILLRALIEASDKNLGNKIVDLRSVALQKMDGELKKLKRSNQQVIATAYENLVGMISSVIHAGYNGIIGPNNEITLIREAWVNIYSKGNEEEKNNG